LLGFAGASVLGGFANGFTIVVAARALHVCGFSNAETHSWSAAGTIASLAVGVALLVGFVVIQRRGPHPLLPLRIVLDRNRGGSFLALGVSTTGIFGVFLFLTDCLQQSLRFSPVKTGLAFLRPASIRGGL
jgi:hypothetical protein